LCALCLWLACVWQRFEAAVKVVSVADHMQLLPILRAGFKMLWLGCILTLTHRTGPHKVRRIWTKVWSAVFEAFEAFTYLALQWRLNDTLKTGQCSSTGALKALSVHTKQRFEAREISLIRVLTDASTAFPSFAITLWCLLLVVAAPPPCGIPTGIIIWGAFFCPSIVARPNTNFFLKRLLFLHAAKGSERAHIRLQRASKSAWASAVAVFERCCCCECYRRWYKGFHFRTLVEHAS
jgi:hypothetical protein